MRAVISVVVVAVTVVLQLTIVDRIAFPGGAGPDLVLLVVAALALAGGPMAGVLTGFLAGLALDVAPPGSHFVGQNALVFCLVGYSCGLLADDASGDAEQGHTALFEIVVTAAGAVCGEALLALLGVMLSDPRVTWPAITNVLPAAVAYNVLLCPFVLYAVAAALRLGGARGESRRAGWSPSQARTPAPGASQGAIRQLAGGNTPRLRLSERDKGSGSIGGLRGPGAVRPTARREPQLKLGRPGQRSPAGLGAAFAPAGLGAGTARVRFGGRRRQGVLGGSLLGGSRSAGRSGSARLGSTGLGSSRLRLQQAGHLQVQRFEHGPVSARRIGVQPQVLLRAEPAGCFRPVRAPRPGLTAPAPGQPGGRRPDRACPPVFPGQPADQAHQRPAPVGRAEVTGPGLAARRLLARRLLAPRLTRKRLTRRRIDEPPRLRQPPDRPQPRRPQPGGRQLGRPRPDRPRLRLGGRGLGHAGSARLRMPRPKSRRRWRSGGYR